MKNTLRREKKALVAAALLMCLWTLTGCTSTQTSPTAGAQDTSTQKHSSPPAANVAPTMPEPAASAQGSASDTPTAARANLVAPDLESTKALSLVRSTLQKELTDYELVDVVGSYYICLEKPATIFHRFGQWAFVFRHQETHALILARISDSRVPPAPTMAESERREVLSTLKPGWIAYASLTRQPKPTRKLKIFDEIGREREELGGAAEDRPFPDVIDSDGAMAISRMTVFVPDIDDLTEYQRAVVPGALASLEVRFTRREADSYHDRLTPIRDIRVDIAEAIRLALRRGAKGSSPDMEGQGGQGVVRLVYDPALPLSPGLPPAPYWAIPYSVGIWPVPVRADTGEVYSMIDETGPDYRPTDKYKFSTQFTPPHN